MTLSSPRPCSASSAEPPFPHDDVEVPTTVTEFQADAAADSTDEGASAEAGTVDAGTAADQTEAQPAAAAPAEAPAAEPLSEQAEAVEEARFDVPATAAGSGADTI